MPTPRKVRVGNFAGSTREEIEKEPDWHKGHNHRAGYRNNQDRIAGFAHADEHEEELEDDKRFTEEAESKYRSLRERTKRGELLNFQDVMRGQSDFHQHRPQVYPPGWRFMVLNTENWIKNEQEWPANVKAREKKEAEEKKKKKEGEEKEGGGEGKDVKSSQETYDEDEEEKWRRNGGQRSDRHHPAYGSRDDDKDSGYGSSQSGQTSGDPQDGKSSKPESEYRKLRERYSPQEIAFLQNLKNERVYVQSLEQSDGKGRSPVANQMEDTLVEIDVADQLTPDNWIPRSKTLIRLTGQHPLNAEPKLSSLFEAGLITPNSLHYVRNHGSVPRLFWETHVLDVERGRLRLSMDELQDRFESINIAVALACDGNRRGELNMIKKSKGFTWGSGAMSCAYWKGARLRDVLSAAGVPEQFPTKKRMWVNFEGADELSEGKYATCIPLDYAMNSSNDVILAYEMNNVRLPPDHGYPIRLLIPGYVGGRSVKWLARIWISDKENESHYHIWDNRVLPPFITEKDGDFARTMFHHPSTACNEQNLNSIIVKPAQGERLSIAEALKQDTYRVEGIAYDGGGHEVQRVELSLDDGETWLYCIRKFPEYPIRNGNKFWTWLHWHIDIDTPHLVKAESLTVRCFNVFKNTQPEHPVWNTMGMMNNGWHKVKPTLEDGGYLLWHHPIDIEGGEGWMKPSLENQVAAAKQDSSVPEKQFTRQEIEKHNKLNDSWLVINNKVYDVTSVLDWHPGGKASILAYAGKLSKEATSSFESIHDEYAHKKLTECVIGHVTAKAANFIKHQARAEPGRTDSSVLLQKNSWTPVKLIDRKEVSEDTLAYTFQVPQQKKLGLGTCQHIQFGIHMQDKMLVRSYTPTRPVLECEDDGTFELTVKTYFPNEDQPGGAFSNFLYCIPIGEEIDVNGPTGEIEYLGNGRFKIEGKELSFPKVSLILGGSGITPGYQLVVKILKTEGDKTQLRVIDANKTEKDILLRAQLDELAKDHPEQFQITHILSHPQGDWNGLKGHVNAEVIKRYCFKPEDNESVVLLCGPPAMVKKAALPALEDWGYKQEENCFGF